MAGEVKETLGGG